MYVEDIALDPGILAKRQYILAQQRGLYMLMAITLGLALAFASVLLCFPAVANIIESLWVVALVVALLALLIVLLCYCVPALQQRPLSMIMWILFTILFIYLVAFLVIKDKSLLFYYALWIVFLIVLGYLVYSLMTSTFMSSLVAIAIVVGGALIVFLIFLIFTNASFLGLLAVMLLAMVYGYYLNYDVRKSVRGTLFDPTMEDPYGGAVRVWPEAVLVFLRFLEMLGYGCCKHKTSV